MWIFDIGHVKRVQCLVAYRFARCVLKMVETFGFPAAAVASGISVVIGPPTYRSDLGGLFPIRFWPRYC